MTLKTESLLYGKNLWRTVYTWPSGVPAPFLKLLKKEEPAALSV